MIVPVFLPHLGCEGRCIYCDQLHITDIRGSDISAVEEVVKAYLAPLTQPAEVGLFGGNIFGVPPSDLTRLFACFEPYRDKITGFRISTKPVPLREETVRLLKEKGVTTVELGVPAFNDRTLKMLGRGHTIADIERAVSRLREEGFTVALQVMVGLPGETMGDVRDTAQSIIRLAPAYIRIYPLAVLKGTPLEAMYRSGAFIPDAFEEAVERALFIYLHALKAGIKVVKMGLTENEVIEERVVAGHYHPAFGYVVKTWAFRLAVLAKIKAHGIRGDASVLLNKRDVPHLLGYKRSNMQRFASEGVNISYETGGMAVGSFLITHAAGTAEGDIFDALGMIAGGSTW
jgi:histone acetyltransferase (RNA polymerase elongator complex component)